MCGSMVDIHSVTGEEKKKRKKKKPQGKSIMSASATQGGHNNVNTNCYSALVACESAIALSRPK